MNKNALLLVVLFWVVFSMLVGYMVLFGYLLQYSSWFLLPLILPFFIYYSYDIYQFSVKEFK